MGSQTVQGRAMTVDRLAALLRRANEDVSEGSALPAVTYFHDMAEYLMGHSIGQDRDELVKLRTAIARLAQRAGLSSYVPGVATKETPFEDLVGQANMHERGWNALVARLMDAVSDGKPREVYLIRRIIRFDSEKTIVDIGWAADMEEAKAAIEFVEGGGRLDRLREAVRLLGGVHVEHDYVYMYRAQAEAPENWQPGVVPSAS